MTSAVGTQTDATPKPKPASPAAKSPSESARIAASSEERKRRRRRKRRRQPQLTKKKVVDKNNKSAPANVLGLRPRSVSSIPAMAHASSAPKSVGGENSAASAAVAETAPLSAPTLAVPASSLERTTSARSPRLSAIKTPELTVSLGRKMAPLAQRRRDRRRRKSFSIMDDMMRENQVSWALPCVCVCVGFVCVLFL